MPKVARIGDLINTGHACDVTAPIKDGSGNVFANGIGVSYRGAAIEPHRWLIAGGCITHDAVINEGSGSVYVNGIPLARVGDSADLGEIEDGSSNVYAGG